MKKNMKKSRIQAAVLSVITAGALLVQATGCGQEIGNSENNNEVQAANLMRDVKVKDVTGKAADEKFVNSYYDFSLELLKKTSASSNGENMLIAPLSVQLALAMTANGAKGDTKAQMEEVLSGGMTIEELNEYLYRYKENAEDSQLNIANSIWFRDDEEKIQVEESFLENNASYYDAGIFEAAFDEQTVSDINNWVNKNTDGMIPSMVDRIEDDSIMYLINALCFEGEWQEAYTEKQIYDESFVNKDGKKQQVSMMHSNENIYLEDENATGFIKMYQDRKYSFVALLPKEGMTIDEYVNSLNADDIQKLIKNAQDDMVIATLPKFSYDYSVSMEQILQEMGIKNAFDADAAEFSGMGTTSVGNSCVGRVLHKTFIMVDGQGTKAGAATSVEILCESTAVSEPKVVNLNRPFFYMIMDNETNLPVFMGTVTDLAE